MNYNSIKKNIREIGLMFLSAGLLLFLSCGSDDTKDVSGEDGDVNSNQYLQVQPNGLNVIKVSSSDVTQVVYPFSVELKGAVRVSLLLHSWKRGMKKIWRHIIKRKKQLINCCPLHYIR